MKLEKIISLLMTLVMSMCTTACDAKEDINMVLNETAPTEKTFFATDDYVKQLGRNVLDDNNVLWLVHTDACVEFEVNGSELTINLMGDSTVFGDSKPRFAVYLDGERVIDEMMNAPEKTVEVFKHEEVKKHTVKLIKLSESSSSVFGIQSIVANCINNITPTAYKDLKIEFIGDSITCGYGVDDEVKEHGFSTTTEDGTKTYAYKACEALDADYSMVCYSGHGIISGYTGDGNRQTWGIVPDIYDKVGRSGGGEAPNMSSIDWDFDKFEPDYVVINLGTNDHSYVKGDAAKAKEYAEAYAEFIKVIRKKYKDTHIICSLGIMGDELFKSIEEAIELSGDKNISALRFSPRASTDPVAADWHPAEATHERAAGELVEHINSLKK